MELKCDECGKVLFKTERERGGALGVEAQDKGFVYKNAFLFSDKYTSLYFCNHDCGKEFYSKHIQRDSKVSAVLEELKKDIPEMAKDVCNKMAILTDKLKESGFIK